MISFGNKNDFCIDYIGFLDNYKDDPVVLAHPEDFIFGGCIFFWVNGKNLFEFKDCEPNTTYGFWDLTILTDFFCNNLLYHITDDPFPAKTVSSNAWDMFEEYKLVEGEDNDIEKYLEVNWDNVDTELHSKIDAWNNRHGFIANRGGSFLPDAFIRKVNDKVEISWRNNFSYKNENGQLYFKHDKGVEYIDIKTYREVVTKFCLEYISRIKEKCPDLVEKYMKNLQKVQEVIL